MDTSTACKLKYFQILFFLDAYESTQPLDLTKVKTLTYERTQGEMKFIKSKI